MEAANSTSSPTGDLRVCVFVEESEYIAQCVEYDIYGHGPSPDEALRDFGRAFMREALLAHQFGKPLLEGVPKPLDDMEAMWRERADAGEAPRPFKIPKFTIRKRDDVVVDWSDRFIAVGAAS